MARVPGSTWTAKNQKAHAGEDSQNAGNIFRSDFADMPRWALPEITGLLGGTPGAPVSLALGTPILLDNAAGATLTLNANGKLVLDASAANALSEGEQLSFSFKYKALDPTTGAFSYAFLKVRVEGHNDGPVAGNDAATAVENAAAVTGSVLVNDSDVDRLDTISVASWTGGALGSTVSLLNGAGATLMLNADGSYVLDASAADALSEGETIAQEFTYTLTDDHGATTTALLAVTVTGSNDGPVALDDFAGSIGENATTSGMVLGNDSDIDRLDVLSVSALNGQALVNGEVSVTLASGAVLTMHADGSYTYDTNHAFDALNTGDQAADSFEYTVSDGHGGTDTAVVSLFVDGVSPPEQFEGLNHGYWSKFTQNWNIATDTTFESFFGLDGGNWVVRAGGQNTTSSDILFTVALNFKDNTLDAKYGLARDAVAAVLNASESDNDSDGFGINYKYSVSEIVAMVQSAFASGDQNVMKEVSDALFQENDLNLFHAT